MSLQPKTPVCDRYNSRRVGVVETVVSVERGAGRTGTDVDIWVLWADGKTERVGESDVVELAANLAPCEDSTRRTKT